MQQGGGARQGEREREGEVGRERGSIGRERKSRVLGGRVGGEGERGRRAGIKG